MIRSSRFGTLLAILLTFLLALDGLMPVAWAEELWQEPASSGQMSDEVPVTDEAPTMEMETPGDSAHEVGEEPDLGQGGEEVAEPTGQEQEPSGEVVPVEEADPYAGDITVEEVEPLPEDEPELLLDADGDDTDEPELLPEEDEALLDDVSAEELLEEPAPTVDAELTAQATMQNAKVSVLGYVQGSGWQKKWVTDGKVVGSVGKSKRFEALRLRVDGQGELTGAISYRTHVQSKGWLPWATGDAVSGAAGEGLRIEALQVKLTGQLAKNYDVWYHVHVQRVGWMAWTRNGATAGTAGKSLRIEAFQVLLVRKGEAAPTENVDANNPSFMGTEEIQTTAHVQRLGWMAPVGKRKTAGTSGKSLRVEALKMKAVGLRVPGGIAYRAHVQRIGWQGWKKDGALAGTTGRGLRVEALQMHLTGEAANTYDLYYRAHVQNVGWLAWASSDEEAGSAGLGLRVEAIQTTLVRKGGAAPSNANAAFSRPFVTTQSIAYSTSVQDAGWTKVVRDGRTSGTSGKGLRVEGLRVSLEGTNGGSVSYRTFLQGSGWQDWQRNGADAGAPGAGKRVEAIQVKLGGIAQKVYNVWYRTHVQGLGWMGWTSNGGSAGTNGMSRRVEAVQIKLVPKTTGAPGSTTTPFCDGSIRTSLDLASGARSVRGFGGFSPSGGAVNAINNAINGIRGRGYDVGFIMMDLSKHKGVAYNCDKVFYGASSIKAPYIASVVSKHPDAVVKYQHNITETLTYSWDYDYKQVYYAYGKGPMRTWCKESGARSSIAESLPWAEYSARDLAKLWGRNYQLFSASSAGETFGRWCQNPNVSTIHTTLGGKYRTRSKAGWIVDSNPYYNVSDDGGIVYAKNGTYVIAIMSSVPANHDMLNSLTAAIDRAHSEM